MNAGKLLDFDMNGANVIMAMTPEERAELEQRFWAKTEARPDPWDKDAPPETWCLCWTGGRSGRGCGYGSFRVRGVPVGAHRAAYVLTHGPIPKGLMVLHSCHNRLCIRGDHLTVGTAADNARDTREAGRTPRGGSGRLGGR